MGLLQSCAKPLKHTVELITWSTLLRFVNIIQTHIRPICTAVSLHNEVYNLCIHVHYIHRNIWAICTLPYVVVGSVKLTNMQPCDCPSGSEETDKQTREVYYEALLNVAHDATHIWSGSMQFKANDRPLYWVTLVPFWYKLISKCLFNSLLFRTAGKTSRPVLIHR